VTPKSVPAAALVLLVCCAGCAGGSAVHPVDVTPAAVPKGTPSSPPKKTAAAEPPVTSPGNTNLVPRPAAAAPAPVPNVESTRPPAPVGEAPPAIASTFVYSPQQAAVAAPKAPPPAPSQPPAPQGDRPPPPKTDSASEQDVPEGELQLLVVASAAEVAAGEVVTVDVMALASSAVVDAPLHLTFDPNVLEYVDGVPGDFLTHGGSSVVFLADGRTRPGDVAIAAGRVVREQGASGAGLLCRVRFRAVGAGASPVVVGQAHAWGAAGESLTVLSTGTTVVVR